MEERIYLTIKYKKKHLGLQSTSNLNLDNRLTEKGYKQIRSTGLIYYREI